MSLNSIAQNLNDIIKECLWKPKGDPTQEQFETAAKCFKALKVLGLPIGDDAQDEQDTADTLIDYL